MGFSLTYLAKKIKLKNFKNNLGIPISGIIPPMQNKS